MVNENWLKKGFVDEAVDKSIDLKKEIEICKKHDIDTSEMVDKLDELCLGNVELASLL